MEHVRKTRDEQVLSGGTIVIYEVQGFYGEWECLTLEETMKDAEEMLECYNENEPLYPHRIVKKRVRNERKE